MTKLNGKTTLITGATSGIGQACARALAEEQSDLILIGRRKERLETLSSELQKDYGIQCYANPLDIRDRSAVNKAFVGWKNKGRKIDILINNAGLARGVSKMQHAEIEDWDEMIDTNIKGLLNVTHALLPSMVERNEGHIVNIGSIAGHEVYPGGNIYCSTKHAVDAITKGLRLDLVDTAVRVSTVDPGLVETEFSMVRFKGDNKRAQEVYKGYTPLRGEDIADAVAYIVTRPPHVQVAEMIVFPTDQASSMVVNRR